MIKINFFSSSAFTLPILESIMQNEGKNLGEIATGQYQKIQKKIFLEPQSFSFKLLSKEILAKPVKLHSVVTQPDRINRKKTTKNPVSQFCFDKKIPTFQPQKINLEIPEYQNFVGDIDFSIVASFGQILNEKVLQIPKYGVINWHPSLLPKYRGATPMQTAILNGDDQTGLTWIQMGRGMDDGNIWLQIQKSLKNEDINTLAERMGLLGAETWAIVLSMRILENEGLLEKSSIPQKEERVSFCKMLEKSDALVKPKQQTAKEIRNHFLAYKNFPQTIFACNYFGQQVKIKEVGKLYEEADFDNLLKDFKVLSNQPRESFWLELKNGKQKIIGIKCSQGFLEIKEIILKNGRKVDFSGFNFV